MTPYADPNFFTRTYLELPDSVEADRLAARAERGETGPLPVTWLHRLEVINSFQLHVHFARSPGQQHVTLEQAALALQCDTFWSFDPKASKLAALEGSKIRR